MQAIPVSCRRFTIFKNIQVFELFWCLRLPAWPLQGVFIYSLPACFFALRECRHARGLSLYGSGYQDAAFQFSFIRRPGGCLSTFYTIYRVFPLRKNLTYLLGFCLFILKGEVLTAASPFIYLIMYIFVKPSFSCICTHE